MTSTIYGDRKKLEEKGADIIAGSINELLQRQDKVILAIPGGRSVAGIFKILKERKVDWSKVHIFMIDERLVTIDDPESNFKLAKESFIGELIKKGALPEGNAHPFILQEGKKDCGIISYEKELVKNGGSYDIILLSSGEDGHVGALYPNHKSIKDEAEHYLFMHDSPKPPKDRMTSSRKLLEKSKVALLLFLGDAKRDALRALIDEKNQVSSCPAKLVLGIKKSYVLTDLKV